jgi:hypothetical protein
MEDAIDRGTVFNDTYDLWDIKDGTVIRDLKGPDGQPFMDGLPRSELRLAWSFLVDWFNPYHNKAAGKAASVGSIVMALLNLPPSLRYKPENLYIVGITPGPKEPSLEETNHFLKPVVDIFSASWKHGNWFSRTHRHPQGRGSRSAIIINIHDLPGAWKVTGVASHSANMFCSLCLLTKGQIRNFDFSSWPRQTWQEHLKAAEAWRDATSRAQRKRLFKATGIRWTELLRLPYWDPTHHVVVDGMHNLFLGLVQFHFRHVLGIDQSGDKQQMTAEKPALPQDLDRARKILLSDPSLSKLRRLTVPVLKALCLEKHINIGGTRGGKYTKKADLISALLVR